jgi:DNA-binding NarL/FixJ family response regulator
VTIRVLVADDQSMIRAGFAMILDAQPDIEVIAQAADGDQAIATAQSTRPDVIVMDIRMPGRDGIAATAEICRADDHARVLIVTTFDYDEYVYKALRAGASGFLLKNAPPENLANAVRVIAGGEALLAPTVTRRMIERFNPPPAQATPPPSFQELTPREQQVLRLMAKGYSNARIATELFIGVGTVKTHAAHILAKHALRDRVQAVVLAYETGFVTAGAWDTESGP